MKINTNILGLFRTQYKEDSKLKIGYSFSCVNSNIDLKNSEINDKLSEGTERIKRDYKEDLTINKSYVETIDNKNVGVIEYTTKQIGSEDLMDSYFYFFFEYEGKQIECYFITAYNEPIINNYLENLY